LSVAISDALLYQRGTVVAVDADNARIKFAPIDSCAACASGQGCGFAPVAGFVSGRQHHCLVIDISGQPSVAINDTVRVGINAGRFLLLVAITYATPLFGLMVGAVTMAALVPESGDGGALLGGVIGGVLAIGLVLMSVGRRRSLTWLGARVMKSG
jgi:positive regulator of sigma E activity